MEIPESSLKEQIKNRVARGEEHGRQRIMQTKDRFMENPLTLAAVLMYAFILAADLYYIVAFIQAFIWLDSRVFPLNGAYLFFMVCVNVLSFVLSTEYDMLNVTAIKTTLLLTNYINLCMMALSIIFNIVSILAFPAVFSLRETPLLPQTVILTTARVIVIYAIAIPAYGMINLAVNFTRQKDIVQELFFFRMSHYVDLRDNQEFLYDLPLGRRLSNGTFLKLLEKDRFLGLTNDGVSGSGKTSLMFANGIVSDLDIRLNNERMQKKIIRRMVREGKVFRYRESPRFCIEDFAAYPEYEEDLVAIKKTYRAVGQTIIAPNADLLDKVCRFSKARGFKVNRIDAELLPNGEHKAGYVGFNPFYIDPELREKGGIFFVNKVSSAATVYRDVMQELYHLSGNKSDAYFEGVNNSTNYNMTLLCLLCYPLLYGRQANPIDSLNEMGRLQPRIVEIEEEVEDMKGNIRKRKKQMALPSQYLLTLLDCYKSIPDQAIHKAFDLSIDIYFTKNFVENLAQGQNLYNQSLGLRNLISSFITQPAVQSIVAVPDDRTINLSRAIERGEITVFNFSQRLGNANCRTLGLFFLLNLDAAMQSRPGTEDTRIPHIMRIDEMPMLIHPIYETMFSLYRQFRGILEVAYQSSAQMSKSKDTEYLQKILYGVGTQVIYGRVNIEEMEFYNKLAGKKNVVTEQVGYMGGSLLSDQPDSRQVRTSLTEQDVLSGTALRRRNFTECTIFYTRNGVSFGPVVVWNRFVHKNEYKNKTTAADQFDFSLCPVLPLEDNLEEDAVFASSGYTVVNETETEEHTVIREDLPLDEELPGESTKNLSNEAPDGSDKSASTQNEKEDSSDDSGLNLDGLTF